MANDLRSMQDIFNGTPTVPFKEGGSYQTALEKLRTELQEAKDAVKVLRNLLDKHSGNYKLSKEECKKVNEALEKTEKWK